MRTIIISILSIFLFCIDAKGQAYCYDCGSDHIIGSLVEMVIIHDTVKVYISNLNDITQTFGMTFDEFVKEFFLHKEGNDTTENLSSERVYLNYFLPLLQNEPDFQSKRVISSIFTFDIEKMPSIKPAVLSDSVKMRNRDILFQCSNSTNIDYFLTSPQLINKALTELFYFVSIVNKTSREIKGIHFDFSSFQFHEKRAMAQFAKSVSLVVDSTHTASIQNLGLYFSFDKTLGEKNQNYLYTLSEMIDSVLLIGNNELPDFSVITKKEAINLPIYTKIRNQFYLARFYIKEFPSATSSEFSYRETLELAHADYPDNNWETYLFVFIGLIVLLVAVLVLYWMIPAFSFYLNKNQDYLFILILMFLFELGLLLIAMIEAMSREDVLNLSGENRNMLLFMPLIFVFVIPLFKAIVRGKEKP